MLVVEKKARAAAPSAPPLNPPMGLTFAFEECLCFGWLGWKIKGKIHQVFHVCFQSSAKCEKIICCGELGTTPSKKLANLGLK